MPRGRAGHVGQADVAEQRLEPLRAAVAEAGDADDGGAAHRPADEHHRRLGGQQVPPLPVGPGLVEVGAARPVEDEPDRPFRRVLQHEHDRPVEVGVAERRRRHQQPGPERDEHSADHRTSPGSRVRSGERFRRGLRHRRPVGQRVRPGRLVGREGPSGPPSGCGSGGSMRGKPSGAVLRPCPGRWSWSPSWSWSCPPVPARRGRRNCSTRWSPPSRGPTPSPGGRRRPPPAAPGGQLHVPGQPHLPSPAPSGRRRPRAGRGRPGRPRPSHRPGGRRISSRTATVNRSV